MLNIKTLADVRRLMDAEYEERFFGRATKRFFGTTKYKFSKRNMTVTCVNRHGDAVYSVVLVNGRLELKHV